ncbi:hypothetical protein LSH36_2394g00001 [Paralvinella palmiformis]|uniref:Uncharacterized protein n=1 Tax=Paralvinella palmiformis TaxID=53620 RepID=A0AAD9IQQ6_9ANNE|nr:hypothetical protein LSH36_2394g00001 [Paralvinella palmiformis]
MYRKVSFKTEFRPSSLKVSKADPESSGMESNGASNKMGCKSDLAIILKYYLSTHCLCLRLELVFFGVMKNTCKHCQPL